MSDDVPPVDDDKEAALSESRDLIANEIRATSVFIFRFAAAVAVELKAFGLTEQQTDEIILQIVKRVGATDDLEPRGPGKQEADLDDKNAGFFGRFKRAADQSFDFVRHVGRKHGPSYKAQFALLMDGLAPVVIEALGQLLEAYLREAAGSYGRGKSKSRKK